MNIVVGFIDTPEGRAAVDYAIDEAKRRNGRLVVVNSKLGGSHEEAEDYIAMEKAMETLRARLAEEGVEADFHEYARGQTPAEDMVAAVEEHSGDMIVIGIRRRSKAGKALLGSNALDILHDSPVPVVCVKASAG